MSDFERVFVGFVLFSVFFGFPEVVLVSRCPMGLSPLPGHSSVSTGRTEASALPVAARGRTGTSRESWDGVQVEGDHHQPQTLHADQLGISWGGFGGVNVGIYGIHGVSGN